MCIKGRRRVGPGLETRVSPRVTQFFSIPPHWQTMDASATITVRMTDQGARP